MIFGLFGSKKKKENLSDLLAEFATKQQLLGRISKAQSLQKLNRDDEAQQVLLEAERMATSYLSKNPHEKKAHMMLALLYCEAGLPERAEPIIERLLNTDEFQLNDEERLILTGEIYKIRRQRPTEQRAADVPSGFTQIYCCANCGRLHNFVSMPCPNCDWFPQTIDETTHSIILSNSYFKVQKLLILAREMANGRTADDVVPNLLGDVKTFLSIPTQRQAAEQVFSILIKNEQRNHRSLNTLRACPHCGNRVLISDSEECETCGGAVKWPDTIRMLACMDNLLWLFEQRIEISPTEAFSDFVCILVAMTNNLLRKQEVPSIRDRQYSLQLLSNIGTISDLNKGAVIDTKNPKNLEIYLVKENMRDDTEDIGIFMLKELEFFVTKMTDDVRH